MHIHPYVDWAFTAFALGFPLYVGIRVLTWLSYSMAEKVPKTVLGRQFWIAATSCTPEGATPAIHAALSRLGLRTAGEYPQVRAIHYARFHKPWLFGLELPYYDAVGITVRPAIATKQAWLNPLVAPELSATCKTPLTITPVGEPLNPAFTPKEWRPRRIAWSRGKSTPHADILVRWA